MRWRVRVGEDGDDADDGGGLLGPGDALSADLIGEAREGDINAVLDEDGGDVNVGASGEGDVKGVGALAETLDMSSMP